ncbi:carbon monoxide dehydrogenase subunit G [Caulobacter sp. S45]|uniref:SRPBCC family protein n=1 Tax=Caulobacter sp. S45 TaxID=1641861 RepID=UPI00131D6E54|nr:carbon monoxide dehydrogenase subunit G [Caulobacter sp. S45]
MEMTGERLITASREKVWAALNDADVLRQSIEGCESLDKTSETEFVAKVVAKLGPVKAKFGGKVTLSDLDPPNGYTLTGEGNGAGAGFAKGVATVKLTSEGDDTRLTYNVKADVSGKLAQIGSRLIEGSAKKMADDFFNKFSANVGGGAAPEASASSGASSSSSASAKSGAPAKTREVAADWWMEPGWMAAGGVLAASITIWIGYFIGRSTARADAKRR